MIKNTSTTYGLIARLLHWVLAILIITLISVGLYMSELPNSEDKWRMIGMHKATGMLVLSLVIVRVIWRLMNVQPELPKSVPAILARLAHANIFILYFLMIAMPVSGILGSLSAGYPISFFDLFVIPAFAMKYEVFSSYCWWTHGICAWLLICLIIAHIGAGLYHHFIRKDNVLRRMWSEN